MQQQFSLASAVFWRFVRGGLASAFASMAVIANAIGWVQTFSDIHTFISALSVAAIMGFITGVILAGDKYFRGADAVDLINSANSN